jgi:hypothetical protein
MSDFDLDRLGDVWRQDPDPAELERLRRSAATVARRARLTQIVDIAAALIVSAVVIALVASNPKADTLAIGAGAILVLLVSNLRLREVRRVELRALTGGTEEMLDQSMLRAETTMRHHRFGMFAIVPAFAIGLVVAATARGGQLPQIFEGGSLASFALGGLGLAVILATFVYSLRGLKRARKELHRLKAMREAYRRERESTHP